MFLLAWFWYTWWYATLGEPIITGDPRCPTKPHSPE
jgi:hypothetical protein